MLRKRKRTTDSPAMSRSTRQRRVLDDGEDRVCALPETASRSPRTPRAPRTPVTGRRSTRKKTVASASRDPTMSTRKELGNRKTVLSDSPRVPDAEKAADPPKPKSKRAASTRRVTELVTVEATHSTRSRAKREAQDSTDESSLPEQKRGTGKKRIAQSPKTGESKPIIGDNNSSMQLKLDRISIVTPKSSPLPVNLTPHRSSKREAQESTIQSPNDTVTPESSPIPVNLTPHRSFKTPKKSPLCGGSPKTHSESPLRASRTPRKLTVLVESPDNFSISMFAETPVELLSKIESSLEDISKNGDSEGRQTFVSSINVQLRTSRERILSGSSRKTSPTSALTVDEASLHSSSSKIRSPKKLRVLGSKLRKSPVKTSVNKLGASPQTNCVSIAKETPGDETTASFIPRKADALLKPSVSSLTTTPKGRIRRSLHLTPDFTNFSGIQTSSPIPRQQKTAVILPSVFRKGEEPRDGSFELVDGDNFLDASGNASTQKEKDGTYEISKSDGEGASEKTERDATYELAEPKTPKLRREARKRSLSQVETSHCTPEAKKRCRVRFATPNEENGEKTLPQTTLPAFGTPGRERTGARSIIGSVDPGRSKRRSRSLTKTPASRTGAERRSNSASAFTDRTPRLSQSIQSSVNRLSRPRQAVNSEAKLEVKVPVPRKIPNFAQIHQKKFEKMESLVDAKKRVAKRHEELSAAPTAKFSPQPSSSSANSEAALPEKENKPPSETEKSSYYNRFGFKIKKQDARKIIDRKASAPDSVRNQTSARRAVLKDVRTNRRFELMMKFRNAKKKL